MSTRSKGAYAVNKTKKYFEALGYQVVKSEVSKMIWIGGRSIIGHTDMWGSDLICMNKDEIIFVQVKSNKVHIAPAKHEFDKYVWAKGVKKYIVRWELRAREPIIIDY
jgi:hypothetical protein